MKVVMLIVVVLAISQIPQTSKEVRYKIMRNIGIAFFRMGQYSDAAQSFEPVLDHTPDYQVGAAKSRIFRPRGIIL